MMGPQQRRDAKLFYVGVNIDERLDADHPLRKIAAVVDFTFVRQQVAGLYGVKGHPSLDPTLLLKLLFLLFYENVSSERELLRQLPCRLDWLWFLEMDLDSDVPDHSVLSKARRRWGQTVFVGFFQQVLRQCLAAGLVDGARVHVDGSLIAANADRDKLTLALKLTGETLYGQLDAAVETPQVPVSSVTGPVVPPTTSPVSSSSSVQFAAGAPATEPSTQRATESACESSPLKTAGHLPPAVLSPRLCPERSTVPPIPRRV